MANSLIYSQLSNAIQSLKSAFPQYSGELANDSSTLNKTLNVPANVTGEAQAPETLTTTDFFIIGAILLIILGAIILWSVKK